MYKSIILALVFIFLIVSSCKKEDVSGYYTGITISGSIDGHDYVDLGLSVKWAIKNIGAGRASDKGDLFAWGETKPKSINSWENYKWCSGAENVISKYCNNSAFGIVDGKSTLDLSDDAAHVNWGKSWRMPTKEETQELCRKCDFWWTSHNGVDGWLLLGPNGNRIFFPGHGSYWSSSLNTESPDEAYRLYVSEGFGSYPLIRYFCCPIRPVTDK